ncbi:MAG: serine/threonine-protein kinase [Myxococcota bacterium]|nr:serine/threonine-protein kinase [Myxococcota bacterium]
MLQAVRFDEDDFGVDDERTVVEDLEPSVTRAPVPFERLAALAHGGMGVIELARRPGSADLFAVKRMFESDRDDPEVVDMFLDEARIARAVRHPNVVAVTEVGFDDGGPFIATEYVEGLTLRDIMKGDAPLPVAFCVEVMTQVARGLHAAHEAVDEDGLPLDLVHRDVSPPNILVGVDGVARVLDFGVAKATGRVTRTVAGTHKGRFSYMSPEQLAHAKIDARSDLFALGVVLYELLAGCHPFGEEGGVGRAYAVLQGRPPEDVRAHRPDVPPSLAVLLRELLETTPSRRPATAGLVAGRLEAVAAELALRGETPAIGRLLDARHADALADQRRYVHRVSGAPPPPATARRPLPPLWRVALTLLGVGFVLGWLLPFALQ